MEHIREAADQCRFSIVIPVWQEADRINSIIEDLRSRDDFEACEIIVVDGDPGGGTINAVEDDRVIKITASKCRARQMNAAAEIARGEILIFLHADTKLPAKAFEKIGSVLENGKYVAGAFDLGIDSDNILIKAIAARARLRARMTRVPYGDQAIFMRKKYFDKIGRFKDILMMEDVEIMQRIRKKGDKIMILRDRVMTSARRWEQEGIFYTTFRNMVLVTLYRFGVSPDKLVKYYKSGYRRAKK